MELNEDDKQWDPMRDDYEDCKFNSYLEGPGNKLSKDIRVENIPPSLTNEGLFNILSNFGEVEIGYRSISKIRENECVAYVMYKSQINANRAIKELHKEKPLYLRLHYTKSKAERNKEKDDVHFNSRFSQIIEKIEAPETDQLEPDNIYIGPKYEEIRSHFLLEARPHNFIINENFDRAYCNQFVNFHSNDYKIYAVFDELYSKLFEADNKKVTLGRRYFSGTDQRINSSEKGISFKFGERVENASSGLCQVCSKKTSSRCKSCRTFYCSRNHQEKDWQNHRLVCLDSEENSICSTHNSLITLKVTHVESNHIYAVKMDDYEKFETLRKRLQEESPKQQRFSRPIEGFQCAVLDKDTNEWCRGVFSKVSAPVHEIFFSDYGFSKPCAASLVRWLHPELTTDEPFALKIKLSSTNSYSIAPGNVITVNSLEVENSHYKATLKGVRENGQSKSVCGFVQNLRRTDVVGGTQVKIVDLSSEVFTEVSIKGTLSASTYFVSLENLISAEKHEDICAYIKIIKVVDPNGVTDVEGYTPMGPKLRVRSICRIASDFFCVEVESRVALCKNGPNGFKSISIWLKKNDAGLILVDLIQRNTAFLATMIVRKNEESKFLNSCYTALFKTLNEQTSSTEEGNYVPEIGSCVAIYNDKMNVWCRGIVWSVSDAKLARCVVIDFGSVLSVSLKNLRPLAKNFKLPPSLTVHCRVIEVQSERSFELFLKNGGRCDEYIFDFVVEEELSNGVVLCSLTKEEEKVCLIEVSVWDPTAEEVGLKTVELCNKMEVKLSQFYSSSLLYVIPADQANFVIEQKLVKLIQLSQPLNRVPRFGELVACKWSKNSQYYRAQILEPFENSEYRIFFVDSGTQEIRILGDIFELDDELKSYPCLAVKICLKNIDSELLVNPAAVNYLNSIGFKEEPLKIVLENYDLSAVELHHLNNIIMNERLNHLVKTEDIEHDDEIYYHLIPYSKLKIGTSIELGLLRKFKGHYMMLQPKSDAVQFVFDKFHDLINEYCEGLTNKGYHPRDNEVVFVQINPRDAPKKCWCRAVVLQNRHQGSSHVQALDFSGEGEILITSIRKMHPKFMHVPPVAYKIIPKLPEDLSSSQVEKIDSFFNSFSTYVGEVTSAEDIEYCVEFKFLNDIVKQL